MQTIILKPGKEKALLNFHHWIFSGAVASCPTFEDGDILQVYSANKQLLGSAYFNKHSGIMGRMIAFGDKNPTDAVRESLESACHLREKLISTTHTNAYRLINGEGDALPGLIVDKYDNVLVLQIATLGMEKLKPYILEFLIKKFNPLAIIEKSNLPTRKEEGLMPFQGVLLGDSIDEVEILENSLRFKVSFQDSQKTGFFLDHRKMRSLIQNLSFGKKVLNCFCYTGAFSVYAAHGKALQVDSVDISEKAIDMARVNMGLNQFKHCNFYCEDVFSFLREKPLDYDIIILDPPAFAKRQKDVIQACRGYKDINRVALQKMPKGSLLLTSSCSYHVDEALFQKVIFQAAREANRKVRILQRHQMAEDHPINIYHPEGEYLKSLLLYVD